MNNPDPVPVADLAALTERRAQLHHVDGRPLTSVGDVVGFLRERQVVMSSAGRSSLASFVFAVAGREFAGSWMAQPECHRIYDLGGELEKAAALTAPLFLGKYADVDPAVAGAAVAYILDPGRVDEARLGLGPRARVLLDQVDDAGEVRVDRVAMAPRERAAAKRDLTRRLLVRAGSLHTESGNHTTVLSSWPAALPAWLGALAAEMPFAVACRELVRAGLRSAVVAPEREVRRWFPEAAVALTELRRAGEAAAIDGCVTLSGVPEP